METLKQFIQSLHALLENMVEKGIIKEKPLVSEMNGEIRVFTRNEDVLQDLAIHAWEHGYEYEILEDKIIIDLLPF